MPQPTDAEPSNSDLRTFAQREDLGVEEARERILVLRELQRSSGPVPDLWERVRRCVLAAAPAEIPLRARRSGRIGPSVCRPAPRPERSRAPGWGDRRSFDSGASGMHQPEA